MKNKSTRQSQPSLFRRLTPVCCAVLALSGCASLGAAPWDRDLMARQAMELNTHPNITAANEHIYFSKEGSSGGRTFDGGGCGCN
jgi:hypothetical protein